jgi:amino acid transporter
MTTMLEQFLSGATMMAYLTVAVFFFRFWRDTRDRLFAMFALAFAILGVNRLNFLITSGPETSETHTYLYLLRLVAFVIILIAIIDKNRTGK